MATCHPPRIAEEVDCPRDCCDLKLVNMTWEGSLAVPSGFDTWRLRSAASADRCSRLLEDIVAHFGAHPNSREDEAMVGRAP